MKTVQTSSFSASQGSWGGDVEENEGKEKWRISVEGKGETGPLSCLF